MAEQAELHLHHLPAVALSSQFASRSDMLQADVLQESCNLPVGKLLDSLHRICGTSVTNPGGLAISTWSLEANAPHASLRPEHVYQAMSACVPSHLCLPSIHQAADASADAGGALVLAFHRLCICNATLSNQFHEGFKLVRPDMPSNGCICELPCNLQAFPNLTICYA